MILATNAEVDAGFRGRHAALAQFVLDRDSPLPDPYRAYMAVHSGNFATFAPTMYKGIGRIANGVPEGLIAFSAVENPPFAYLLTFDEKEPDTKPFLPAGGLATFAKVPYELHAKIEFDLLIGFRKNHIPGDYGQD